MIDEQTFLNLLDEGKSYREIAEILGTTPEALKSKKARMRKKKEPESSVEKTDTSWAIDVKSSTIRTVEDAIKEAKVDLTIWSVERSKVTKWDQGSKDKDKRVQVIQLWHVQVWLKRRVTRTLELACEGLIERMKAVRYMTVPKLKKITDPHMCYIGLHDIHFGKLAWAAETGENYDLKYAEKIYLEAGYDLVAKARSFPIEKWILPVGHDFLHIDSMKNQTTAGTPQDADGRFAKIFEVAQLAVVKLVDYLLTIAPVQMIWIPGNHDYESSYFMCKTLQAWYRNVDRVEMDTQPTPRKYLHYGQNLIGCTHGNEENVNRLASLMAEERKQEWANTRCREWLLGHFHKAKEVHFNLANHKDGVMIRTLPSLSGSDAWHFKKGYVSPDGKIAQALVYSKDDGFVGQFNSNFWRE